MDPHFQHVLQTCQHPDLRARLRALDALEKAYLEQVEADFLLFLLHREPTYQEQSAILRIMSQMGPRAPVAALVDLLGSRETENWMLREQVAATLAALRAYAPIALFIRILQDPTEESGLRKEIAGFLGEFGEHVPIDVLVSAVADPDPDICAAAIGSLMEQGARAPLKPILTHVAHPVWRVRKAVVRALSHARERAPIEPIVAALSDVHPCVREAAAGGVDLLLEWFGAGVPLAPLYTALADEDAQVRETALDALANHPQFAPIELVVAALQDQNAYVRCAALLVLERIGNRVLAEVYPAVLRMSLADPYPTARKLATKALRTLKGIQPGAEDDNEDEDYTLQ